MNKSLSLCAKAPVRTKAGGTVQCYLTDYFHRRHRIGPIASQTARNRAGHGANRRANGQSAAGGQGAHFLSLLCRWRTQLGFALHVPHSRRRFPFFCLGVVDQNGRGLAGHDRAVVSKAWPAEPWTDCGVLALFSILYSQLWMPCRHCWTRLTRNWSIADRLAR